MNGNNLDGLVGHDSHYKLQTWNKPHYHFKMIIGTYQTLFGSWLHTQPITDRLEGQEIKA